MKIIFDHQVFSLQNAGGASRYFIELIRYLCDQSLLETHLLLGLTNTLSGIEDLDREKVTSLSIRTSLPPGMIRYFTNEILSNIAAPWKGTFNIYHSTYYRFIPFIRFNNLVATHHDCVQESLPSLFPDARKIIAAKQRLYRKADAIICVSEASQRDLFKFYDVDPGKVRVIYHGLSNLIPTDLALGEIRQIRSRPYLLYVGSRFAYKNFNGFVNAFYHSNLQKDFDLLVIGGGQPTLEEKRLITSFNMNRCVRFIPYATDHLLAAAYSLAHLFVYPSLFEGFGFPPLEAMSLRCPVLVANTSSLPEICKHGALYFEPKNEESLIYALKSATSDTSLRCMLISNGREVASEYNWKKCGDKTLKLYHQLG